jgi:hypothetical protein
MIDLPPYPSENTRLSATWARQLLDAVRSRTPVAGVGLTARDTPTGVILEPVRRPGAQDPAAISVAEPFDVAFSYTYDDAGLINGSTATFSECQLKRGTLYIFSADLTHAMPALATCYIAVRLHTKTGVMDIVSGANKADVCDTVADDETPYDRTLLYRCSRSLTNSWCVSANYRRTPYGVLRE